MKLFDISGKTALITGGASGIGLMATQALAEAGCTVLIASRKGEICEQVATAINQKLGKDCVQGMTGDLSSEAGVAELVAEVSSRVKHLDILMNNAGATWGAPLGEFPWKAWDKVNAVNVTGVFALTQSLLPLLEANASAKDPARIVNLGSFVGTRAMGNNAYSYTASKAAVHHLTKVLSNELAARKITVNALAPGPFPSKMMAYVTEDEQLADLMRAEVPLGRLGRADDIAGAMIYLCSRAGSYVTGAILPLDGGMAAKP
ncbi:Gluconate 5-dehydrogenase [hydrothermal vent metagenome]|uniref:Gluconate 5-dehydrogenase n=1 Tax=hydrothermal vent metagenome TaxID=652676 RepID=A0A3B0RIG4_9ZZZZ